MKIEFFIAGFQKSATTKIKELIARNSNVCMHTTEEMTFFIDEEYDSIVGNSFIDEYFLGDTQNKVLGAKNVSMAVSENSIRRLSKYNPDCKIILVLRNPIHRAYSAFWYCRRMGWETSSSFDEALEKPNHSYAKGIVRRNCDYIGQGIYADHLLRLYKYFPERQVKVYILEEDFKNIVKLNEDVCSFIGIVPELVGLSAKKSVVNSSALPRFRWLTMVIKKKSILSTCVKKMMPTFVVRRIKVLKQKLVKLNEYEFEAPSMSEASRVKLIEVFSKKNTELEVLLKRDLLVWRK